MTNLAVELDPKRVELLHELVPAATIISVLLDPINSPIAESQLNNIQAAARSLGLQLYVLHASNERDFEKVFASLGQLRIGALAIGASAFFNSRSEQLATLALRHAVPAIYQFREFAAAGGLMSYSSSITDEFRQVGVYTGRILKGEKPADLPVQQSTKVELIINLKTAKALGLTVPPTLLARADEVNEKARVHQPVWSVGCGIVARSACPGVGDDAADRHLAANRSDARKACRQEPSESSIERQPD